MVAMYRDGLSVLMTKFEGTSKNRMSLLAGVNHLVDLTYTISDKENRHGDLVLITDQTEVFF